MAKITRQERIRRALRADAQNNRIISRSVRDMSSSWRTHAASIANRAASGRGYKRIIREMTKKQQNRLADLMTYVYFRGYKLSIDNARDYVVDDMELQLSYTKEVKQIIGGLPLTEEEVALVKTKMTADAKRVLTMAATDLEKVVKSSSKKAADAGMIKRDAIRHIKTSVVGVKSAEPYRLEAIYRTSANMSYSAGRWEANQNPAIQSVLWGYEYVTVGDGRVRDSHAAYNGTRAAKDSTRWATINPPNSWNCRCSTTEIYLDEPEAKSRAPKAGAEVDKGFRFNPGTAKMRK